METLSHDEFINIRPSVRLCLSFIWGIVIGYALKRAELYASNLRIFVMKLPELGPYGMAHTCIILESMIKIILTDDLENFTTCRVARVLVTKSKSGSYFRQVCKHFAEKKSPNDTIN